MPTKMKVGSTMMPALRRNDAAVDQRSAAELPAMDVAAATIAVS